MSKSNKRHRRAGSPNSAGTSTSSGDDDPPPGSSSRRASLDHQQSSSSDREPKKKVKRSSSVEKSMKAPTAAPSVVRITERAPAIAMAGATHARGVSSAWAPAASYSRAPPSALRESGMEEIAVASSLSSSPMRLYSQMPATTINVDPWGASVPSSLASTAMILPTSRIAAAGPYQVGPGYVNQGAMVDPFGSTQLVQLRPDGSIMPLATSMYQPQGPSNSLYQVIGAQHPSSLASFGPSALRLAQPLQVPSFAAPFGSTQLISLGAGMPRLGLQPNFQLPAARSYQFLDSASLTSRPSNFYPSVRPPASVARGSDGFPLTLPVRLSMPEDEIKLSDHQVLLREQIEAFEASEDDASTHTRGRNKPIVRGQVGIRCVHCKHISVNRRLKGSTYYPASLLGLYQAAQNMSTTHLQCGLCPEMPMSIKHQFAKLLETKPACSGAGRPYWAKSAEKLGLVDTEEGIRFIRNLPPGLKVLGRDADGSVPGA